MSDRSDYAGAARRLAGHRACIVSASIIEHGLGAARRIVHADANAKILQTLLSNLI